MAWIGGAIAFIVVFFAVLRALDKRAQVRRTEEVRTRLEGEIRSRLEGALQLIGGEVVGNSMLRTPHGEISLLASQAPQRTAIDVTKFSVSRSGPQILQMVPVQDAQAALSFKNVRPVVIGDPTVDESYKVVASDEAFARILVTPALVSRMKAVDGVVRARSRLLISTHGATLLVPRGLHKPEDLKAFYDAAVQVMDDVLQVLR